MSLKALPVQSSSPTPASTPDNTVQAVPLPFTAAYCTGNTLLLNFFNNRSHVRDLSFFTCGTNPRMCLYSNGLCVGLCV